MGCIDHQFEPTQMEISRKSAFAKLNVATCRIIQPAGFAQLSGVHPLRVLFQHGFDTALPGIVELGTQLAEKFDAVIGVWVVAGTDHNPQMRPLRSGQIGHRRGRHRTQ